VRARLPPLEPAAIARDAGRLHAIGRAQFENGVAQVIAYSAIGEAQLRGNGRAGQSFRGQTQDTAFPVTQRIPLGPGLARQLGLERTARIVQQVPSVYDTDGYQLIMEWIAAESGVAYGDSPAATKAHRILADHGRGMTFLVGDGVIPGNEGRGYVLRRIVRRAVQQARTVGLERVAR